MADTLPTSKLELTDNYLFGLNLTAGGKPFPDSIFTNGITTAVEQMQTFLDIDLLPVEFYGADIATGGLERQQSEQDAQGRYGAERHDYVPFDPHMMLRLNHRPVRGKPSEIRIVYPGNATPMLTIPASWIQLSSAEEAVINVIPAAGSPSNIIGGGIFGPYSTYRTGTSIFPCLLHVDYRAGFDVGKLPADIKHAISMVATFPILNLAGDLIGGPGIASFSLSLGGLSQSVNTTSSPMYAGFGARLNRFDAELKALLPALHAKYHGVSFGAV